MKTMTITTEYIKLQDLLKLANVVEDTAWSWSYTADKDGKADVTLSSTTPNGEAGITNTYVKHDWLTSIVDVINKWTAKDNIDNTGHVPGSGTN